MTSDQLEAVIRQQFTRVIARTVQLGQVSTAILNDAAETVLAAADEYGAAEYGGTADRRAALAAAVYTDKRRRHARIAAAARGEL